MRKTVPLEIKRIRTRSTDCTFFDFEKFSYDVEDYAIKNGLVGNGGRSQPTTARLISRATDLDIGAIRYLLIERQPCSLRVACKLADWADLSLDSYIIKEFG